MIEVTCHISLLKSPLMWYLSRLTCQVSITWSLFNDWISSAIKANIMSYQPLNTSTCTTPFCFSIYYYHYWNAFYLLLFDFVLLSYCIIHLQCLITICFLFVLSNGRKRKQVIALVELNYLTSPMCKLMGRQ